MAKYSKGAQKAVASAMKRMEKGTLRSGKSDKKVTDPKQAIAIGLSEAKEKGAKVPAKKGVSKAPKKSTKKIVSKKAATKKPVAPAAKKEVTKAAARRTSSVKTLSKKAAMKKAAPRKITKLKEAPEQTIPVSEETILRAANLSATLNEPPVEEKSPAVTAKHEEQRMKGDKKLLVRVNTKRDSRHIMQPSQNKSPIRPSGKKPLWN